MKEKKDLSYFAGIFADLAENPNRLKRADLFELAQSAIGSSHVVELHEATTLDRNGEIYLCSIFGTTDTIKLPASYGQDDSGFSYKDKRFVVVNTGSTPIFVECQTNDFFSNLESKIKLLPSELVQLVSTGSRWFILRRDIIDAGNNGETDPSNNSSLGNPTYPIVAGQFYTRQLVANNTEREVVLFDLEDWDSATFEYRIGGSATLTERGSIVVTRMSNDDLEVNHEFSAGFDDFAILVEKTPDAKYARIRFEVGNIPEATLELKFRITNAFARS